VKKTVFFVALCAAITLCVSSAMAQAPASMLTLHPGVAGQDNGVRTPGAPSYCKPCLYYGGDWASADQNWVAFANADGWAFGGSVDLYSGFTVPKGKTWTVTGLVSNNLFFGIDHFTPSTPEWAINKGMAAGKGGKVVAHGKTKGSAKATGRSCCSAYTEYSVIVPKLPKTGVKLAAGKYVEMVTPPCDSTKDSACGGALSYESDTYDPNNTNKQGANHFGPKATAGNNFQNGSLFGLTYQQINDSYCTSLGYQPYACNFMSAGVMGKQK